MSPDPAKFPRAAFRGQFIFGGPLDHVPTGFRTIELPQKLYFHHSPDLPVAVREVDTSRFYVLVGLVCDPANVEFDEAAILESLTEGLPPAETVVQRANRLAGRWAIIAIDDGQQIAFHDACGTMPLQYTSRADQTLIASSTMLLGHCLDGLVISADYASEAFEQHRLKSLSGLRSAPRRTELIGVYALSPNHLLDLKQGAQRRYYPVRRFPQRSAAEVAPAVAEMMVNIVRSASQRFQLAIGVTSGFDSRLPASAIHRIAGLASRTVFFTIRDFECPPGHADITNGRRIAEAAGGTHVELVAPERASDLSRRICRQSEYMIAPRFEAWSDLGLDEPLRGRTALMGWCGELGRAWFRWPASDQVTFDQIMGMAPAAFMRADLEQWFAAATQVRKVSGIHILDLWHWENMSGRWAANGLNILNSASNWMSVYSCRDLLDLMLSVKEQERKGEVFYKQVIGLLLPPVSRFSFNPKPFSTRLKMAVLNIGKGVLVRAFRLLGIYEIGMRIRRRVFKR